MIPSADLIGEVDLPVYSIVQGGRGALVLENEPFTHTTRPKRLIGKKDGYGVLVIGNSMAREYSENDIAYIDPRLHPRKGDPCVFQGTREDGSVEAMLKYLERSPDASETLYYVSQSNPLKKFTIKKSDWQKCHVAVGKESGR
jgi:phage repressor protein C with HTH and peptisase S24 domain